MAHTFSFDVPDDAATALAKASSLVKGAGGSFAGDENGGTFAGKTPAGDVKGRYQVAGKTVTIEITDKPFIVPKTLVESKVKEFFGA